MKETVGAALRGCRAPFRLVQDHSRSGRLEAPSMTLRSWLFTHDYNAYLSLIQARPLYCQGLRSKEPACHNAEPLHM